MKKLTKALATAAVTTSLLAVGVTAASATTAYPSEGGTWNYGVTGKHTSSDYLHSSRTHKSTAVGATTTVSAWTSPGVWSRAQAISAVGGNKAYYDVK